MLSKLAMQKNTAATSVGDTFPSKAPALVVRTWSREEYDEAATRQLHFVYRPLIPADATEPVTAGLLQHWPQERSNAVSTARPMLGFRATAGVLTKRDRFFLGYAASALEGLQSRGFAGRVVITLSAVGLTDPLLTVYLVSQLQRRGVNRVGLYVSLAPLLAPLVDYRSVVADCVRPRVGSR